MEIYPIWELKNASARPLRSANSPFLSLSLSFTHRPSHTQRGTTLHHCALHANLCYDLLNPVERIEYGRLTLHSDGGQEAVLNLNISADSDANTYCVTYTLHPFCLSVTPLTPFAPCLHYGRRNENGLHPPSSNMAPFRASTVLKTRVGFEFVFIISINVKPTFYALQESIMQVSPLQQILFSYGGRQLCIYTKALDSRSVTCCCDANKAK